MCRSKKDGRKGGGHQGTRSKWREAKDRRRARTERRRGLELALSEHVEELSAEAQERWIERNDYPLDEWEWTQEYVNYSDRHAMDFYDDFDDDRYEEVYYEGGFLSRVNWEYSSEHFWDDTIDGPESRADIFLAVDRAVRRHGLEKIKQQAHILAAALDVSVWEIEACLNYTREGYIRRAL